jgi:hypothetical protein
MNVFPGASITFGIIKDLGWPPTTAVIQMEIVQFGATKKMVVGISAILCRRVAVRREQEQLHL